METMLAKAVFIGGQITVTEVSPSPEVKSEKQLDIFPIETPDEVIKLAGDFDQEEFSKGQEIRIVTISW